VENAPGGAFPLLHHTVERFACSGRINRIRAEPPAQPGLIPHFAKIDPLDLCSKVLQH
jgi:hypothetical protein